MKGPSICRPRILAPCRYPPRLSLPEAFLVLFHRFRRFQQPALRKRHGSAAQGGNPPGRLPLRDLRQGIYLPVAEIPVSAAVKVNVHQAGEHQTAGSVQNLLFRPRAVLRTAVKGRDIFSLNHQISLPEDSLLQKDCSVYNPHFFISPL